MPERVELVPAIRVFIVDDHPVIRAGIRDLIEREPDLFLTGEASSGSDALQFVKENAPDVVLLDMRLPDMSGIEVAQELKRMGVQTNILALSAYSDRYFILEVLKAGVAGYLIKDELEDKIAQAIRGVARGEQGWISRQAVTAIADWRDDHKPATTELSFRENQILEQITAGKTNRQIANTLGISVKTVEKHIRHIFIKLNASSRTEAAVIGTRIHILNNHELVEDQ
jgi:DNA-binding NarL/FixJ family response regulator